MLLGRGVGGARVAPRCAVRIEAEAIASRRVLLGVGAGGCPRRSQVCCTQRGRGDRVQAVFIWDDGLAACTGPGKPRAVSTGHTREPDFLVNPDSRTAKFRTTVSNLKNMFFNKICKDVSGILTVAFRLRASLL